MASIQRIKSPLTGEVAYRAQIRMKGRPSESATFSSRAKAESWAKSLESAIEEGRHFPHAKARRTSFDALAADYVATALTEFDDKQRDTREQQLTWWSTWFAGKTVAEITPDQISKGRDACAAETFTRGKPRTNKKTGVTTVPKRYKRTPATVNRYLAALSAALTFAVKERQLIDRNPAGDISRKKEPRGRTRFLSDEERTALLDACEASTWPALHALVLLALTTGARRGELIGLTWVDVDVEAGTALVTDSKNGEQRMLPLVGRALDAMKELKAARDALKKDERSEFVFPNPSGHPGLFEYFDDYWNTALDAAGIKNFHFHDLRHTTASMLAAQGCSLLEIADVLGHKTLAMVKRYSHLVSTHKTSVIQRMVAAKGL
jgi:integrase